MRFRWTSQRGLLVANRQKSDALPGTLFYRFQFSLFHPFRRRAKRFFYRFQLSFFHRFRLGSLPAEDDLNTMGTLSKRTKLVDQPCGVP